LFDVKGYATKVNKYYQLLERLCEETINVTCHAFNVSQHNLQIITKEEDNEESSKLLNGYKREWNDYFS